MPENLTSIISPEKVGADPMGKVIGEHFKAAGRTRCDFDALFDTLGEL